MAEHLLQVDSGPGRMVTYRADVSAPPQWPEQPPLHHADLAYEFFESCLLTNYKPGDTVRVKEIANGRITRYDREFRTVDEALQFVHSILNPPPVPRNFIGS